MRWFPLFHADTHAAIVILLLSPLLPPRFLRHISRRHAFIF